MKNIPQSEFVRFDMNRPPSRQRLRPLIWLLSFPDVKKHKSVITKVNMDGVKPPYLLMVNHNAFLDFKVVAKATFPHRCNNVVAIDGFLISEWLLRAVGCICKRKFTKDLTTVKHLKKVIDRGDIVILYPEARYSLCGTNALLPDSLGKLAKFLRVPVVTIINHGHHVNSPFWNLYDKKISTESTMTCLLTAEQIKEMSVEEVNAEIQKAFYYDDFKWQWEKKIKTDYAKRAEGLHKVLYQCPSCNNEYRMASKDDKIMCTHCGKSWTMSEYGRLSADEGETEFEHIPDWYEWERANVKKEVEAGTYSFSGEARVDSLPNAKGYIDLGNAQLKHNMDGFFVEGLYNGEPYKIEKTVESLYSCHIEYNYLGKHGDCIDLNTLTDTFYIYPYGEDFSVTKMALATEELYKHKLGGKGIIPDEK